jgi:hypothetical protein
MMGIKSLCSETNDVTAATMVKLLADCIISDLVISEFHGQAELVQVQAMSEE